MNVLVTQISQTVYDPKMLVRRLIEPLLRWERLHTHPGPRCVVRQERAVEKRPAGLDCVAVGLLGSVVMPGSASVNPPETV